MTNEEKIKSMNIDELTQFIFLISNCANNICQTCPLEKCKDCREKEIREWLLSSV